MNTSSSPNPRKASMQAHKFLRSFARINLTTLSWPLHRRSRAIKRAAYVSMARAASPRRLWTRAILGQLQQPRHRKIHKKVISTPRDKLRRLVPGGEEMGFCRLLEETVNYVDFLSKQVRIMEAIANFTENESKKNEEKV